MWPARSPVRSSSAGSLIGSAARCCASSRSPFYFAATAATAASWGLASFFVFRFLTGAGIGGEYTAINSTIQELIPARFRGRTDLAINGTFWVGAALGAVVSIVLLGAVPKGSDWGWRLAFLVGAVLGLVILFMRMWIPESPRWLVTHGYGDRAHAIVADIEARACARTGHELAPIEGARARLRTRASTPLLEVVVTLFRTYSGRTLVGLSLMTAQAFFYNAIFFTYALILTNFYGVPSARVGWYILPFAAGNFLGPLLLGRFFDTIGRKTMIASTYIASGLLLALTGYLFSVAVLSAQGQTIAWMMIFFCCLGSRQLRLSHGRGNLPARNSCGCDRVLFRDRHRNRRRGRPALVRRPDRHRLARERIRRLSHRRRADGCGRRGRMGVGCGGRAAAPRSGGAPARGGRLSPRAEARDMRHQHKALDFSMIRDERIFNPDLRTSALLLDVDGTIVDIASSPDAVHVPTSLRDALSRLIVATGGAVALVSGRLITDLDHLFAPLRLALVGGHGAELRLFDGDEERSRAAQPLDAELKRQLKALAQRRRRRRGQGDIGCVALPAGALARRAIAGGDRSALRAAMVDADRDSFRQGRVRDQGGGLQQGERRARIDAACAFRGPTPDLHRRRHYRRDRVRDHAGARRHGVLGRT